MSEIFIQRDILTKCGGVFQNTSITIGKPSSGDDGLYCSVVTFSNVRKYNANIRGIDEFNSIECAIDYVDGICHNSSEPEFFFKNGESLFRK
jgi:uncharacterized ferredoxin-like protein